MDKKVGVKTYHIDHGIIEDNVAVLINFYDNVKLFPQPSSGAVSRVLHVVTNIHDFPILLLENDGSDYSLRKKSHEFWVYGPMDRLTQLVEEYKPIIKVCVGNNSLVTMIAKVKALYIVDAGKTPALADRMLVLSTMAVDILETMGGPHGEEVSFIR